MANVRILFDLMRADSLHYIPKGSVLRSEEVGRVVLPDGSRAFVPDHEVEATDDPLTEAPQRRLSCQRCDGTGDVQGRRSGRRHTCVRCGGDGLRRERPLWGWSLPEGGR
jgi:hypothetical protein